MDPERIITEAQLRYRPITTLCLFSGGNDSAVVAHRCRAYYDTLVFIDTGTAVPGVRDHVEQFAGWLGKPLVVTEAGDAYRRLVLGLDTPLAPMGFPSPVLHGRVYGRLKERPLARVVRDLKEGHPRTAKVLALTGLRRAESRQRRRWPEVNESRGLVFANPLIDWGDERMRVYRKTWALPESDVAALLHRSGECNCSCFSTPGDREMLRSLWPEWFESFIAPLEREAEQVGARCTRWGSGREVIQPNGTPETPPLCTDCVARIEVASVAPTGKRYSNGDPNVMELEHPSISNGAGHVHPPESHPAGAERVSPARGPSADDRGNGRSDESRLAAGLVGGALFASGRRNGNGGDPGEGRPSPETDDGGDAVSTTTTNFRGGEDGS